MCSLGQLLDLSPEFLGSSSLARGQLKGAGEPEYVTECLSAYRLARPTTSLVRQAQVLTPEMWRAREQQGER